MIDPKVLPSLPTAPANLNGALGINVRFWVDHGEELEERSTPGPPSKTHAGRAPGATCGSKGLPLGPKRPLSQPEAVMLLARVLGMVGPSPLGPVGGGALAPRL